MSTDVSNKSNFCYAPFAGTVINNTGLLKVCCKIVHKKDSKKFNINEVKYEEWWNSNEVNALREQFLNNEKPEECAECWKDEEQGIQSMRQRFNHEFKILKPNLENPKLLNLELSIGNTCNLRCLMCNEQSSSEVLKENTALKISNFNSNDFATNQKTLDNYRELISTQPIKILNLRGGEPLYDRRFKKLLLELDPSYFNTVMLHLTTNCTQLDDDWIEIIKKFKLVRLMASIEGVDLVNDYIRYPSVWDTILYNIKQFKKLNNVNLVVNYTVQNLNVLYLDQLLHWLHQEQIYGIFNMLYLPKILEYTNLPLHLRKIAIARLNKVSHLSPVVTPIINSLTDNNNFDPSNWKEFINYINLKDSHRGIKISDYLIDFKNL